MINWRGKDYQFWTDALKEQAKEIERLTADNALLQVAAKRADNIERHRDELQARVEALEVALFKYAGISLAATEQEKLPWTDKDGNTQSSTLYGSGVAATEQEKSDD